MWTKIKRNCSHVISPSVYHGCTTEPGEIMGVQGKDAEIKGYIPVSSGAPGRIGPMYFLLTPKGAT